MVNTVNTKSSFFLAILLIANPFMLLLFQNCSSNSQDRVVASLEKPAAAQATDAEPVYSVGKNLKIK